MESIGTAKLKNNLSRYLRKVRKGASILVMDRDEPVAQLIPVGKRPKKLSDEEILADMEARGLVLLPKSRKFPKAPKPLDLGGDYASQAVIRDREESW